MPPPSPSVRLAPADQAGAIYYNAYQFLTLITALYAHASASEDAPERTSIWNQLSDAVLTDLGLLYEVWEPTLKSGQTAIGAGSTSVKAAAAVVQSCQRLDTIHKNLTVWTGVKRCYRLLCLCERRWQRQLHDISLLVPALPAPLHGKLVTIKASAAGRLAMLELAQRQWLQEEDRVNSCFDLVGQSHADP